MCSSFAADSEVLLELDGKIYPSDQILDQCKEMLRGSGCANAPLGYFHVEDKKEGDDNFIKASYRGPEGIQFTEEAWEKGGHVLRAVSESSIFKKLYELEVKNGKAYFKTTDQVTKSVQKSDEDAPDNLVVPATLFMYLRQHTNDLIAGKEIKIRMAALDRNESYGFTIQKTRDEKNLNGETVSVLKLSPNSIVVKAFVDPMYFYVKPATFELVAFEGKSCLRRKVGDHYQEMNSRVIYDYKIDKLFKSEPCSTSDVLGTGGEKCTVPTADTPAQSSSTSTKSP
jgi:hypothetical protein